MVFAIYAINSAALNQKMISEAESEVRPKTSINQGPSQSVWMAINPPRLIAPMGSSLRKK